MTSQSVLKGVLVRRRRQRPRQHACGGPEGAACGGLRQDASARLAALAAAAGDDDADGAEPSALALIKSVPRLLRPPLPVGEAAGVVEGWLAEPNVRWTGPGPHHHALVLEFLRSVGTAGNLTTDVQLAAVAVENDATICSIGSDFARFDRVRWINPLTPR